MRKIPIKSSSESLPTGHNSGLGKLPLTAFVGTETAFQKNELSTPSLGEFDGKDRRRRDEDGEGQRS
jgi:hypothetical protein